LTLRTIDVRVTTYRSWYPTYGDVYALSSVLIIEPRAEGLWLLLPRRLASFRIQGPVRVHIVDGVSQGGNVVGLTLLPGVDVAEPAPGVPNPGDLIHDQEGNILLPAADL
jgi:hypothetical protein